MKAQFFTLLFFFIIRTTCLGQPTLFGMTSNGGIQCGSIFSLPLGGNSLNLVKYFNCQSGDQPECGLIKVNGKLYGCTTRGGEDDRGILFEYEPLTQSFTKLFDFTDSTGIFPIGSPILAPNNKLYGVTTGAGSFYSDYLFEYDISSNIYTKKINIYQYSGGYPQASPTYATNGKLYGTTTNGGANNLGDIYEYDYNTNTYTSKFSFSSSSGSNPIGSMILANNGKLYGCTQYGGANGKGAIFEYDFLSNTYVDKFDFSYSQGTNPSGSLFQATNGNLYGLTQNGSASSSGVLFEYNYNSNVYTKKVEFNVLSLNFPYGSLIQAGNGKLYGTTWLGGANYQGGLFEYDINSNICLKLVDLSGSTGVGTVCNLIEGLPGKLFGLARSGGSAGRGVFFQYDISSSTYTNIENFGSSSTGSYPEATLLHAANGKLYGMTPSGGMQEKGVLFEYDYLTDTYTVKVDFSDSIGTYPKGNLIEISPGRLLGVTNGGGVNNRGVIFEYNYLTQVYEKKYDFIDSSGSSPRGSLVLASNGKLYGWTYSGGSVGGGVIFEYDYINNSYIQLLDLVGTIEPSGSLIEANNGKLYGMTFSGGANNRGALIEYDYMTDSLSIRFDFGYADGRPYQESLVKASNNKLYGTIYDGGSSGHGFIFEFDPQSYNFVKRLNFNNSNGSYPRGSLLEGSNGKLYGTTTCGGNYGRGVIYEYDYTNSNYTKLVDLYSATGYNALGSLIELNYGQSEILDVEKDGTLSVYPNPAVGMINVEFFYPLNTNDYSLSLMDLTGRVVRSTLGICSFGLNHIDLDLKDVAKGLYVLRLQSTNFSETIPLTVN